MANMLNGGETAISTAFAAVTNGTSSSDGDGGVAVTVNAGTLTVTKLNLIKAASTGTITAAIGGTANALTNLNTEGTDAITMTVDAGTAAAADLATIDGKTSVAVAANAVTKITGSDTEVRAALTADGNGTLVIDGDFNTDVTGDLTVANAKTIAQATSGTVDFTGTITDAALAFSAANGTIEADFTAVRDGGGDSAVNIVVNNAVNAAQGKTIAQATTGTVDFSAGLSDTMANLLNGGQNAVSTNLTAAADNNGDPNVNVTVASGTLNVTKLNLIKGATTGTITASIGGTANALTSLNTGNSDAITMTLDAGTVDAADLIALVNKTSVQLASTAVSTITGTLTEINAVIAADGGTIDIDTNFNTTIEDTTIEASALTTMSGLTTGLVTASASTITGTTAELLAMIADNNAASGIATETDVNFGLDAGSTTTVTQILSLHDATTGVITAVDITGTHTQIVALANNARPTLENATGTIQVNGANVGETMVMTDVGTKADLTIFGNGGIDTIFGAQGDDTIIGGTGNDILKGAAGTDTFRITDVETNGTDVLYEFTSDGDADGVGAGRDKIEFSAADLQGVTGFANYTGTGNAVTIKTVGGGPDIKAEFITGAGKTSADAEGTQAAFIFNQTTGTLSFDADGSGTESTIALVKVYSDEIESDVVQDLLAADLNFIA